MGDGHVVDNDGVTTGVSRGVHSSEAYGEKDCMGVKCPT